MRVISLDDQRNALALLTSVAITNESAADSDAGLDDVVVLVNLLEGFTADEARGIARVLACWLFAHIEDDDLGTIGFLTAIGIGIEAQAAE